MNASPHADRSRGGAPGTTAGGAGDTTAGGAEGVPGEHLVRGRALRLVWRTLVRAWDDGIFGMSAQAAFWMALSLPPLLLGLLGSLGFVSRWFGADTISMVQREILQLATTVFSPAVVDQIIRPTVNDILTQGRSSIVSVGFVLSLWAGSSALASLVDSITTAYRQHTVRNPVWQRTFALLLYAVLLVASVFVLPILALGPGVLPGLFPESARPVVTELVVVLYYPVLAAMLVPGLATLYKIVLPNKLPWHRGLPGALLAMVVFLVSSTGLRLYISWVTSTGYTYGALATPIAFLLFSFFIAMAVVLGAEFNHSLEELWPSRTTRRQRRRARRLEMQRRAARDSAERGADRDAGGDADPKIGPDPSRRPDRARPAVPTTAPSPADTTRTVDLPRNGAHPAGQEPAAPDSTEPHTTEPHTTESDSTESNSTGPDSAAEHTSHTER